jgi:hypothetical protein
VLAEEHRFGPRRFTLEEAGRVARYNSLIYSILQFLPQSCHPAGAKPDLLWELAGGLKARDLLEAVRNAIDGFQLFLFTSLRHRTSPSKREYRDARQQPASGVANLQ